MEWFHKCAQFFALATEQVDKTQELYTKELDAMLILGTTLSLRQAGTFIKRWISTPFLKIEDLKVLMRNCVDSEYVFENQLWAFEQHVSHEKHSPGFDRDLLDAFTEEYLKQIDSKRLIIKDYLAMEHEAEKGDLSLGVLKKAQQLVLIKILDLIKQFRDHPSTLGLHREVREIFFDLKRSQFFTPTFLDGLVRRFGPDLWSKLEYSKGTQDREGRLLVTYDERDEIRQKQEEEILKKDKIDIYDIHLFLLNNPSLNETILKDLFKRSNEDVKEYLHSLIYAWMPPARKHDYSEHYFMLSEDLTPMNENYEQMKWPDSFHGWRLSQQDSEVQDTWLPIFHDFKIIPA